MFGHPSDLWALKGQEAVYVAALQGHSVGHQWVLGLREKQPNACLPGACGKRDTHVNDLPPCLIAFAALFISIELQI